MQKTCPCPYKIGFGVLDCEPPGNPGVNANAGIICLDDIANIVKIDCDDTDPTSGVISDINLKVGAAMIPFVMKVGTGGFTSGESVNDNGGVDITETFNCKGGMDPQSRCWLRNFINREVVLVFEDSPGNLEIVGWNGGLKLNDFLFDTGKGTGDTRGSEINFINNTGSGFCRLDLTKLNEYVDNADFMNSLINP